MKVGSKWGTIDRTVFQVTDIKEVDNQTWIYYNNILTKQEYSCLKEAFINRFNEIVNNG
jgi:hypothetical protein